jgi:hypothetical protein
MDVELKVKSELDTLATLSELKKSAPELWTSPLPMPFTRAERQTIKLEYKGSDIEEGSINIAIGKEN